jgi:hypothetical protein
MRPYFTREEHALLLMIMGKMCRGFLGSCSRVPARERERERERESKRERERDLVLVVE